MAQQNQPANPRKQPQPPTPANSGPKRSSEPIDVWSRWGGRYRGRAIVLLAINVLLFMGVGSFAYWVRSGVWFAPAMDNYSSEFWKTCDLRGEENVTLASLLLDPISVQEVPMQIPILGLLMAALISIPILLAILYRFWSALPFVAIVSFVALIPWLAVTLLISCVIASVRPFRSSFRFTSALLGLVPAAVYFVMASQGISETLAGRLEPIERMKLIAPWVLAIVAAVIVFAIVLTLAKIVNYRPGMITPLLATMLVLPVALFELHVGRDELYYRLLENVDREAFADKDSSLSLRQMVEQEFRSQSVPRRSRAEVREIVETEWLFELASDLQPHRTKLQQHKHEIAARCDEFLGDFPTSRYVPNVLYIKARALDARVDQAEFRRTKWIRFYRDFPSEDSRKTWRTIITNWPDSDFSIVGWLRLAQLEARSGKVESAIARLGDLIARVGLASGGYNPVGGAADPGVLERRTPEAALVVPLERTALQAHRLYDLLRHNNDPLFGYQPISGSPFGSGLPFGMLDLDPRSESYITKLKQMETTYPRCQLQDNIDLEIAKATSNVRLKIVRLERLIEKFPKRDAVPEALFRLGVAYRRNNQPALSRRPFERLMSDDFKETIWARQVAGYARMPIQHMLPDNQR